MRVVEYGKAEILVEIEIAGVCEGKNKQPDDSISSTCDVEPMTETRAAYEIRIGMENPEKQGEESAQTANKPLKSKE